MDSNIDLLEKFCKNDRFVTVDSHYEHRRGYQNIKEEIEIHYETGINEDSEVSVPALVCINCHRIVGRNTEKTIQNTSAELLNRKEDCELCTVTNRKRETGFINPVHMGVLDKKFHEFGYVKLSNHSPQLYCKMKILGINVYPQINIEIKEDLSWSLSVSARTLSWETNPSISDFPQFLNGENVTNFLTKLSKLTVCSGNTKFSDVIQNRIELSEPFLDATGAVAAVVECSNSNVTLKKENFDTIRHPCCSILFKSTGLSICNYCTSLNKKLYCYRGRLKLKFKNKDCHSSDTSSTNLKYLTRSELEERLRNAQKSKREALRTTQVLTNRLNKIAKNEVTNLDSDLSLIRATMHENQSSLSPI